MLSALDEKQQKALTPLIAVDSQAFTALITATDSADSGQARQRYATIVISKTTTDATENSSGSNSSNNNNNNNASANNTDNNTKNADNKKPKDVKVVSQRLWAFRPIF